jgi:hypothetical protein
MRRDLCRNLAEVVLQFGCEMTRDDDLRLLRLLAFVSIA